jgi:glycosyltransferase involved in cell wall biosynthesis
MNQRIKILYIITQGAWGGAQRYVFDLATNLGEEFEIFVAVGEQDGPQDLQKKLEDWQADHDRAALTILQLKHLHRSIRPNQDIQAVLEIARLYQRIRPDIVHLNSTKAGIIGSFAKFGLWFRRAAVVYTVHGWVFNEPLHDKVRWLYAWLEKVTARCKDKIIVLSKPDKDSGTRVLQVSENCFTVIPQNFACLS